MCQSAHAVPFTFEFAGEIDSIDSPLSGAFSLGRQFNATMTFDSGISDGDPNPNVGHYFENIYSFDFSIEDYFSGPTARSDRDIIIWDDVVTAGDVVDRYEEEVDRQRQLLSSDPTLTELVRMATLARNAGLNLIFFHFLYHTDQAHSPTYQSQKWDLWCSKVLPKNICWDISVYL